MAMCVAPLIGANVKCRNDGREGPVHGSSESVRTAFLEVPGAVADTLSVRHDSMHIDNSRNLGFRA
jgi:hypothetical protein